MKNGFTLIEVLIAAAILSLMLAGVMTVLLVGQDSFNQGTITVYLESEATRILDWLTMDLPECRIESSPTDGNNHTSMTIQIPVEVGGAYWDAAGNIYWGASGNQGWTITYQFSSLETLDETVTQKDYNRDGDILDKFERGKMMKIIKDATDVTQESIDMGRNILVVFGDWDGDVDSDGVNDPIFLRLNSFNNEDIVNGNRIRINLWLIKEGSKGIYLIVNNRTDRTLLNPP